MSAGLQSLPFCGNCTPPEGSRSGAPRGGPIFIFLGLLDRLVGLADRLPRDYELLRGNSAADASRRHRCILFEIILVILHNNIIFCDLFECLWIVFATIVEKKT